MAHHGRCVLQNRSGDFGVAPRRPFAMRDATQPRASPVAKNRFSQSHLVESFSQRWYHLGKRPRFARCLDSSRTSIPFNQSFGNFRPRSPASNGRLRIRGAPRTKARGSLPLLGSPSRRQSPCQRRKPTFQPIVTQQQQLAITLRKTNRGDRRRGSPQPRPRSHGAVSLPEHLLKRIQRSRQIGFVSAFGLVVHIISRRPFAIALAVFAHCRAAPMCLATR